MKMMFRAFPAAQGAAISGMGVAAARRGLRPAVKAAAAEACRKARRGSLARAEGAAGGELI